METQKFKGDALELSMEASASPVFDQVGSALDEFYEGGFTAADFLLMLYDKGRMPFSKRIKREAFVGFIRDAIVRFPVTGTFEFYLFVLLSIFGESTEVRFSIPGNGKLAIDIEANANSEFEFLGREYGSGGYDLFTVATSDDDTLIFRGASGIESEYELNLLFSEIVPAGIVPEVTLGFFVISDWSDDSDDLIVDDDDHGIIFVEGGA